MIGGIKKGIVFILFTISCNIFFSQEKYEVSSIPNELKENANAVVRNNSTLIEILALDNMIITKRRVVTVLNKFGDSHTKTFEHYDDSRSIQKLTVKVLDAQGELITKYKKSNFKDMSAVSNGQLFMDDRIKHLKHHPISYPYTIVFESTVKEKSTAFLNNWVPIGGYYVSLEKSTFKLINYTNSKCKFKSYNFKDYDFKTLRAGNKLSFSALHVKAVERENLSPDFLIIMPWIRLALNTFELKGEIGKSENWKEFGLWQYEKLLANRDEIEQVTKNKITALISDAPSRKEKIKRIYNYVQDNTRYVGVQLGIGGWQPVTAKEVDRVKYGDCKGLTNYTKALLKSQNIESYYSVVNSDVNKKDFEEDFASLQGNHAFLCVPNEGDNIWLECTSQTIPFGFLGNSTDDRDVLVVTPEGGKIVHTPIYDENFNTFDSNVKIILDSNGGFKANYTSSSKGVQFYEQSYKIELKSDKLKEQYLKVWSYLNGVSVNKKELKVDKDKVELIEKLDISVSKYASKVGDKLLVAINPFNRLTQLPTKYLDRKLPFQTNRSFSDTDQYTFQLPENYVIEAIPESFTVESEFGSFKIEIESFDKNQIKYTRKLTLFEGNFSKEKYSSYRDFIIQIIKKDNSKFLLNKQS
jgi:hypothetical protein